jgi:hypothetical protein
MDSSCSAGRRRGGPNDPHPRPFRHLRRRRSVIMLPTMFVVSEADASAIRDAYEQEGELSAARGRSRGV